MEDEEAAPASRRGSTASRRLSRSAQHKAFSVDLVKSRYILKTVGLIRDEDWET